MSLVELFKPCFALVVKAIKNDDTIDAISPARLLMEANAALDNAVRNAPDSLDAHSLFLARRIVAAWMDERLTDENWSGKDAWALCPLQTALKDEKRPGQWFFDALRTLNPEKEVDRELAELSLYCLDLGLYEQTFASRDEYTRQYWNLAGRFGL